MESALDQFDTTTRANEGVTIQLTRVKDGKPSGVYFTIYGADSDVFRQVQIERARDALHRQKDGGQDLTPEEYAERSIDTLARCTKDWDVAENSGLTMPEFSYAAALKVYRDHPAIREQINEAMAERRNFLLG